MSTSLTAIMCWWKKHRTRAMGRSWWPWSKVQTPRSSAYTVVYCLECTNSETALVLSQHADYTSLDIHGLGRYHYRLHCPVRRLQAPVADLSVQALERGVCTLDQGHHDLPIARVLCFFHQHIIAVNHVLIFHSLTLHLQHDH